MLICFFYIILRNREILCEHQSENEKYFYVPATLNYIHDINKLISIDTSVNYQIKAANKTFKLKKGARLGGPLVESTFPT